jgi:DNA-binding NarL/FixJ family response regulator
MRVVLAEDHVLVRMGMRLLLESMANIEVVGEASALRRATEQFPGIRVLVVSMHADEGYVQKALAAGAAGYLLKGSDKSELELALRTVVRGQVYLTPAISHSIVTALGKKGDSKGQASALDLLTPRQREILQLVAEGNSTKKVAARLSLSVKTVESHRAAIMQRLGIRDLTGLVRFAMKEGLVSS